MTGIQASCFKGRYKDYFLIATFSTRAGTKCQPDMRQKTIMPGSATVHMFARSLRSLIFPGI